MTFSFIFPVDIKILFNEEERGKESERVKRVTDKEEKGFSFFCLCPVSSQKMLNNDTKEL
jgi:hypothetical protein